MASKKPLNLVLRKMRTTDLDSYRSISVQCFGNERMHHYRAARPHNLAEIELYGGIVAEVDGQVVGFLLYMREHAFPDALYVSSVGVAKNYQGRGIGRAMLRRIQRRLTRLPVAKIVLHVREKNTGAIKLYRDLGFVKIGLHPWYYRDGANAEVMEYAPPAVRRSAAARN